jgi:hypothetical protein
MLKTEELRIGNLVYFNDNMFPGKENQIVEIIKISKNFVYDKTNKNTMIGELENYKPIEINQDILLKLGFNWNDGAPYHDETILEDCFFGYSQNEIQIFSGYEYKLLKRIKYVHQFQNIYFLLTNKELKTKLL